MDIAQIRYSWLRSGAGIYVCILRLIPRLTPHTERGNDRTRLQTEQPKPEVYLTAFSTIYWMLRTIRACVTQV